MVHIARELPEMSGELPRLYVVTRNAQTVVAGDVANLDQAELRGLIRVIGTEHPHLTATQIDVDEATGVEQLAQQAAQRIRRGRNRVAQWSVVYRTVVPRPVAPRGAADHRCPSRTRPDAAADPHSR